MVKNSSYVIYYDETINEHSRVCISVNKKTGIAVIRNKIKRQIREMVTDIFDFSLTIDYVIVVRNSYLENNFVENKEKLNELYLKIKSKLRSGQ